MRYVFVYRAYKQMIEIPCHNDLYPVLGEFYMTRSTYQITRMLDSATKLPEFVHLVSNAYYMPNLTEFESLDSMPINFVRIFLTDDEKTDRAGTIKMTVWECLDKLYSVYRSLPRNPRCKKSAVHVSCLKNQIKSMIKNASEPCRSLTVLKHKLNI